MWKFIVFLFIVTPISLLAQNWHVTAFGGIANYQGDMQEKRVTTSQSHGAFGLGVQYDLNSHIVLRSGLTYGKISGDDKLAKDDFLRLRFVDFLVRMWRLKAF